MSISRALNMCLDTIEGFFRKDKTMKKITSILLSLVSSKGTGSLSGTYSVIGYESSSILQAFNW